MATSKGFLEAIETCFTGSGALSYLRLWFHDVEVEDVQTGHDETSGRF